MFHKPFRVKSQTAIKGSDRKKLRVELGRQYPSLLDAVLATMVPNKEEMTVMKVNTHSSHNVTVYCRHKNPAFFQCEGVMYPTVYTLYEHPELMPVFTTWPPVFSKLLGGADLMLPGVVVRGDVTPAVLGNLPKGTPCAIKLMGNKCPVAIGHTSMSSQDMYASNMRGKGVTVLHCYQDQLWALGDRSDPPVIDEPDLVPREEGDGGSSEEEGGRGSGAVGQEAPGAGGAVGGGDGSVQNHSNLAAGGASETSGLTGELDSLSLEDREPEGGVAREDGDGKPDEDDDMQAAAPQVSMDELLYQSFLCAIKFRVKKSNLPLLASTFHSQFLLPCCPREHTLDVKKSSYKKLSKFLESMQQLGVISIKELTKGVTSITEIHRDHTEIRDWQGSAMDDEDLGQTGAAGHAAEGPRAPIVTELFMITANTIPLFKPSGFQKGQALNAQQLRKVLTDYVKANELQDTDNNGYVILDPILSDLVLTKGEYCEYLRWDELYNRCQSKMSPAYQVTLPGQAPVVKKGKLEPVTINVVQRSGNKKVTLVENLENFGVVPEDFAHEVQVGVACSTSVSPLAGHGKGMQVLIQGNQVNYVGNLLIEKYRISRKYIHGLDKAPKGKKKR